MARFLSQPNRVRTLLVDALSFPLHRRGYAAGAASDVSGRGGLERMVGKVEKMSRDGSEASSAWAPDPVTGYYRPINHAHEIDPVELRQMLLSRHSNKFGSSH